MAVIDLSTAGIRIGYAIETTAGTKPAAFTNLAEPKTIPDLNPEPNNLETSHLNIEAGGYKTYIEGLKDFGGAIGITFNMSQALFDTWNTFCDAAEAAKAEGKRAWLDFYHPGINKSFFMAVDPSPIGFPEAGVDEVWEATVYVLPVGDVTWAEAVNPTDPVTTGE